ncbi:hypothetical protein EVAR_98717_1 [Eumeta japonica]|uniref:Uncharacterized protein n=1 Tax=Eumeta variegata TaxID=151549 RepID=A0A4C1XUU3_EUMVA|nr:hypothetical protein EVAR_98717_1 [Eumeta japonica]
MKADQVETELRLSSKGKPSTSQNTMADKRTKMINLNYGTPYRSPLTTAPTRPEYGDGRAPDKMPKNRCQRRAPRRGRALASARIHLI